MTYMGDKWQRVTGSGCVGERHPSLRSVLFPVYIPSLYSGLHGTLTFPKAKPWLEESTKLEAAVQIVFFSIRVFSWDSKTATFQHGEELRGRVQLPLMEELHTK